MTSPHAMSGTLLHAGTRTVATRHGDFAVHVCQDLARRTYGLVIARGDVGSPAPLLARVHSSCVTSETYGGCDCDCAEQLDAALAAIAAAGRGVVFYLDQEGRGAGFAAKVRDRMLVQASRGRLDTFEAYARMGIAPDLRSYEVVAAARTLLGISAPLMLLTNNPEKLALLTALGVPLAGSASLALPPSDFNRHYLAAKADAGHRLAPTGGPRAEPPGSVEPVGPAALAEAANLVGIGAYWLPIRAGSGLDAHWFRLHAYVDLARGRERVVLTYGDATAHPVLLHFQREALLERLPGRERGPEQQRWAATVAAFVAEGAGVAVLLADESCASVLGDAPSPAVADTASLALARHHLAGRGAMLLLDDRAPADDVWTRALAGAGITLAASRVLDLAAPDALDRRAALAAPKHGTPRLRARD